MSAVVALPAARLPRPNLPHPQATVLLDHAEHPETRHRPHPWLPEEAAPGLRARNTPADEAGGVGIALQLGETVEILDARRAQQQAFGFDADVVGVHAGFRFTRVVICPLQERRAPRAFVLVGDRKSTRLNSSH